MSKSVVVVVWLPLGAGREYSGPESGPDWSSELLSWLVIKLKLTIEIASRYFSNQSIRPEREEEFNPIFLKGFQFY